MSATVKSWELARALRELARVKPKTLYELRAIDRIGDAKLEAFGKKLVELIIVAP